MSGIIYELAVVEDHGTHWRVTNVTKNTLDGLANRTERMLKLSYMTYQIIKDALLLGKQVKINKTLTTDEVLPWEVTIVDDAKSDDLLSQTKEASIIKIRMLVTPDLAKISGFALYGFIILNNDMAQAGYIITNDNREEQYLKILETGDEKLISKLEDYLNYKDEIESVANLERKFSTFRTNVNNATSVAQVIELEQNFLETFYANN